MAFRLYEHHFEMPCIFVFFFLFFLPLLAHGGRPRLLMHLSREFNFAYMCSMFCSHKLYSVPALSSTPVETHH